MDKEECKFYLACAALVALAYALMYIGGIYGPQI